MEESEEINCLGTGEALCLHSDAVWLVPSPNKKKICDIHIIGEQRK